MTVTINLPRGRSYAVSVRLPQVSTARLRTTLSLATFFTALWFAAPAYLPFATIGGRMVVAGFVVPYGVGYVTLLLAERRAHKELGQRARQNLVERTGGGLR